MEKHWKTTAAKPDGSEVTLFTTTTDELVEMDLASGHESLISLAHRTGDVSNEMNHSDLAIQTFFAHCKPRKWRCNSSAVQVLSVPDRATDNRLGHEFMMPIWEEFTDDAVKWKASD